LILYLGSHPSHTPLQHSFHTHHPILISCKQTKALWKGRTGAKEQALYRALCRAQRERATAAQRDRDAKWWEKEMLRREQKAAWNSQSQGWPACTDLGIGI